MKYLDWEPLYSEICGDFGISPAADTASARALQALTLNSDLRDEDSLRPLIGSTVSVVGDAPCLEKDLGAHPLEGCVICSGSAVVRLMHSGRRPDIVVTDLDGDIEAQFRASSEGSTTLILAHSDNTDLVRKYAACFKGPVVLTTQGPPFGNVFDFGGFTDGDRCVCLAREFGAKRILLYGFDFEHPSPKAGSDPGTKLRKLAWARKIIFDGGGRDIYNVSVSRYLGHTYDTS